MLANSIIQAIFTHTYTTILRHVPLTSVSDPYNISPLSMESCVFFLLCVYLGWIIEKMCLCIFSFVLGLFVKLNCHGFVHYPVNSLFFLLGLAILSILFLFLCEAVFFSFQCLCVYFIGYVPEFN